MEAVMTPASLVRAGVQRNDASAFSQIYQAYYRRIFAFIYSRVQDPELTRDLAADVFERAYANAHTLRDEAALRAWLFMIARNAIAGHFRRLRREMRGHDRVKDGLRHCESQVDADEALIKAERLGQLMRHFRCLPARDQELLSLKFDAELSHADIARITGLTAVNVRVSIFRALKRLRALIEIEEAGG